MKQVLEVTKTCAETVPINPKYLYKVQWLYISCALYASMLDTNYSGSTLVVDGRVCTLIGLAVPQCLAQVV